MSEQLEIDRQEIRTLVAMARKHIVMAAGVASQADGAPEDLLDKLFAVDWPLRAIAQHEWLAGWTCPSCGLVGQEPGLHGECKSCESIA